MSTRARIAVNKHVKVLPSEGHFLTSLEGKTGYLNFGAKVDCLSYDLWLCLHNASRAHWVLLVVLFKKEQIIYLDSKTDGSYHNDNILKLLLPFIGRMHMRKFQRPEDPKGWSIIRPSDIPDQTNSYDCGIHLGYWVDVISSESSHTISPKECESIRPWIINEILEKHHGKPLIESVSEKTNEFVKPIRKLPAISEAFPEACESTHQYCKGIIRSLFKAEGKKCSAGKDCKEPEMEPDMYKCELCREYYRLESVHDIPSEGKRTN